MEDHDYGTRRYRRWILRTVTTGVAVVTLGGLAAGSPVTLTCFPAPTG